MTNGSEATLWRKVGAILRLHPRGHIVRVENVLGSGTPDVNYSIDGAEGWIELKYLPSWPANEGSVVNIHLFSKDQRIWLHARSVSGGRAWLLVQVGTDYVLFNGTVATIVWEGLTRTGWENVATAFWKRRIDDEELVTCLKSRFPTG